MKSLILVLFLALEANAKITCYAHRGGGWNYFENSMSAFKAAIEEKFEGVEMDLHQTKDGQLVLLHDNTLSKVAIGTQCPLDESVSDLSFSNIY